MNLYNIGMTVVTAAGLYVLMAGSMYLALKDVGR